MKHRVNDIYNDSLKLFSTNTYITTDDKLSFMSDDLNTFDLIAKYDYGAREILTQFLDDTELDYKISDIHEAIYMNMLKNLRKYSLLYSSDLEGEDIVPSADYKITRQYGEEEKHFSYGQKSAQDSFSQKQDTNVYGSKQDSTAYGSKETTTVYGSEQDSTTFGSKETTNVYGQKTTTDNLGQGQQTVTSAPRTTNSQDQRTTFDSEIDYDTTHNITTTVQTIDTTVDASKVNSTQESTHTDTTTEGSHTDSIVKGQHTDTVTEGTHTDTYTEGTHTDTITEGAHTVTKTEQQHSDNVVYDEHTDNVYGYKGNPIKNIQTFRKYLDDNTLKTIVAECINTVTYSIYMYTGQM